ncbi:MAG: hypothetical protein KF886_04240 [Candidatus Hydrogenedentes bacterium]|nr:hypothetical protein [Candidatus Hydrogenedentota bacterium]
MSGFWALCILLAAPLDDGSAPRPPVPDSLAIPESLTRLLGAQPEFRAQHLGYLRSLAGRPDLAESETGWWEASRAPALRAVAARFDEALAGNATAQLRFDAFYRAMSEAPALRKAVEHVIRTEMDQARHRPELAPALQYLRANPDIALRFLKDPRGLRPLPEALTPAYDTFVRERDWTRALFEAYDALAQSPGVHQAIFPWWRALAELVDGGGGAQSNLDARLYRQPSQYWLWHLRNLNLVENEQAAPWIRYWQRLIQRDGELAREYGPFITRLLENPEQLRQHLADLVDSAPDDVTGPWPPPGDPPELPPLKVDDPIGEIRRRVERPRIERPERPSVERPARPQGPNRPKRPTPPQRPGLDRD